MSQLTRRRKEREKDRVRSKMLPEKVAQLSRQTLPEGKLGRLHLKEEGM